MLFVIILLAVNFHNVFASIQNSCSVMSNAVVVHTDKKAYNVGDPIIITGEVDWYYQGKALELSIQPPGEPYAVFQIPVNTDKTFSYIYSDTKNFDKQGMTYTINVDYGSCGQDSYVANGQTTFFLYTAPPSFQSPPSSGSMKVQPLGLYSLDYVINGGALVQIFTLPHHTTMDFKINPVSSGTISVDLPRDDFNAELNGVDLPFKISSNTGDLPFTEKDTGTDRILTITFQSTTTDLSIIGTPSDLWEFASLAIPGQSNFLGIKWGTAADDDSIQMMTLNPTSNNLSFPLNSPSGNGVLYIDIPRTVMDANSGNSDGQFSVLDNNQQVSYVESKTTSTDRVLKIPFNSNNNDFQIIGTKSIPEFGSLTLVITSVSIIGVIIIQKRIRF